MVLDSVTNDLPRGEDVPARREKEQRAPAADRTWLASMLVFAFGLRVTLAFALPNINFADEVYQVEEQAYRLVFGHGLVPWEFAMGIRSWIFPAVLAGPIEVSRLFGDSPEVRQGAVLLFMCAASLTPVVCGFLWGRNVGGLRGGVITGGLNAVWVDLLYFAPHPLTEVIGADVLVVALYLLSPGLNEKPSPRRFLWAGIFLALTAMFRYQLAPALALVVLLTCGRDLRGSWWPLLRGAAPAFVALGLVDAVTWDWPWQSIWLHFWTNLSLGVSDFFGTAPWFFYIGVFLFFWSWAFYGLALASLVGAFRLPALMIAAITIIGSHSLIGHKELRFIFPAIPLLVTCTGIGTTRLLELLDRRSSIPSLRWYTTGLALGAWAATSLLLAISLPYSLLWKRDSELLAAYSQLNRDGTACGLVVSGMPLDGTLGQFYLRNDLPIYATPTNLRSADAAAFNHIVVFGPYTPAPGFQRQACYVAHGFNGDELPICLWSRPGRCLPDRKLLPSVPFRVPPPLEGRISVTGAASPR